MKIMIVSGFLGAGKTTFIAELIRHIEGRFVILENEYGTTDIDSQVLSVNKNANVWDLSEGCVCCSKSADLTASVITIENVLSPDYLIVEPSGVGVLSRLLQNLKKIEYDRITLLKPVTIIDAYNFLHNRSGFSELYDDQLRSAGTVLISKPESPDAELRDQIRSAVCELNPDAVLPDFHYRNADDAWWHRLLTRPLSGALPEESESSAELQLETCTLDSPAIASPANLVAVLDNILRGKFGAVVRAKGLLPAGSCNVRFDITGGIGTVTGAEDEVKAAQCVFIGRNLDRLALMQEFDVPVMQQLRPRPYKHQTEAAAGIRRMR